MRRGESPSPARSQPRGKYRRFVRRREGWIARADDRRARSQRAYRTSFAVDLGSSAVVGLVELAEVWVLQSIVTARGGMRFR